MDLTFWSTMGQVSATFVGLVFVSLSIYLGSIRSAITEVHSKFPLQENSSRLMYVAMWSNLSVFVLPLLTSIGLIFEQEHPQIQPAFSCLVCVILAVILVLNLSLYWRKTTQSQFGLLQTEVHGLRKLLRLRLSFAGWVVPAIVIIYELLLLLHIAVAMSWAILLLKGIAWLSIAVGLSIGIFDLVAFDTGNIFFRVSENFRHKAEDREQTLKTRLKKIDAVFARWRGLASDPQLIRRISQAASAAGWDPETGEKRFRESCERTILAYDDFKADILKTVNPTTDHYRFIERIGSSNAITLRELQEMSTEVARLFEATTAFSKYLSEKYERLEKWNKEAESQENLSRSSSDQITAHNRVAVSS